MDASPSRISVVISTVADIVSARQRGRELSLQVGFSETESTLIATIISELARNIVLYAKTGEIVIESFHSGSRNGIVITSRDSGPGIQDLQRVLAGGYSTSGGLGLGLSGVRRMVDEFYIETGNGDGTTVTARKWLR